MTDIPFLEDNTFFYRNDTTGNWFNYKTNELYISSLHQAPLFANVLTHEFNHFYWHCATPYGLFLDNLNQFQNDQFTGYIIRHGSDLPGLAVLCPVYKFAYNFGYDSNLLTNYNPAYSAAGNLADLFAAPWAKSVYLERLLEGTDVLSVRNSGIAEAIKSFNEIESRILRQEHPWPLVKREDFPFETEQYFPVELPEDTDFPACPLETDRSGRKFPIGAFHIFEGIAQIEEHTVSIKMRKMLDDAQGYRYWILYVKLFQRLLQLKEIKIKEELLPTVVYRTLMALADIALHTPVGIRYYSLRNRNTQYYDIHPGYRFYLMLQYLGKFGALEKMDTIKEYQDAICNYFGWPLISSFHSAISKISPRNEQEKRHKEAALLRQRDYSCFISDSDLREDFFMNHAPIVTTKKWPTMLPRAGHSDKEFKMSLSANLVNLVLSKCSWNIMKGEKRFSGIEEYLENIDLAFAGYKNKTEFCHMLAQLPPFKQIVSSTYRYI